MTRADLALTLALPKPEYYIGQVEKKLAAVIDDSAEPIRSPAQRMLQGGSKRLRPMIVMAAGLCGSNKINTDLVRAAAAIELLHLGSLVHDDVLDHSKLRWNQPTIFDREGQNTAILVGDYFLATAAAEGARVSAAVSEVIARTIATMCEGQALESASLFDINRTRNDYFLAISKKTAAVFAAACQIGGICSNLPSQQLKALSTYGERFGMAFQLTDDLLDLYADSSALGKPVGNDIKEGNYTLPVLMTLRGASSARLQQLLRKPADHGEAIAQIIKKSGSFEKSVKLIETYNRQSVSALKVLKSTKITEGLANLPDCCWQLAKQKIHPSFLQS